MEKHNQTTVTEFLLLGLHFTPEVEMFVCPLFFLIYLLVLLGNLLIIVLVIIDYRLHTPMYYFLSILSFNEIMISTIIFPKILDVLLSQNRSISFAGCLTQCYFYFLLGAVTSLLLAVMSYDRYVAISNPLRYMTIMSWRICHYINLGCWVGAILYSIGPTVLTLNLPFCGPNKINHFFCDVVPLIKLSCSDTKLIELIDFCLFSLVIVGSLLMTVVSYSYIIVTVLQIPTVTGRQKAFTTCAAHLTVLTLGCGSTILLYVTPTQGTSKEHRTIVSMLIIFVTPVLNPFIFSLRNENVKQAFLENLCGRWATPSPKP